MTRLVLACLALLLPGLAVAQQPPTLRIPTAPEFNDNDPLSSERPTSRGYVDRIVRRGCVLLDHFGADPTGAAASDAAWNAAKAALGTRTGGCITFGPGTYKFTIPLATTLSFTAGIANLTLQGAGSGVTRLYWPNGEGIAFTLTTNVADRQSFNVRGMTLLTGTAAREKVAIMASSPACTGESHHKSIEDVTIIGYDRFMRTSDLNYWGYGISTRSVSFMNLDKVDITGSLAGQGGGVAFHGAKDCFAIVQNISNSGFWNLETGFYYGEWAQGVQIANTNFTNSKRAIVAAGQNTLYNNDQLSITNSQFDTTDDSITLGGKFPDAIIRGNLFYTPAGHASIVGTSLFRAVIANNIFQSKNSDTTATGVAILGNEPNSIGVITGNLFLDYATAVALHAGTSGWNVQSNAYRNVAPPVANAGGSGNIVGGGSP